MPSNYAIRTFFLSSLVLLGSSCASYDVDFEPRYFSPKARIYFDLGTDDADEVDLFQDGSVTPTIDFVNVFWSIHKSSKKKAKDAVALYDRQMELVAKRQFDAVKKSELENL
ncbi:MAG: hypothetical protein IIB38_17265, partial [Candidatus Hydrogenedentes bacterium]|nr:hypothetical protein [Candidatus Hydrogenedentota bacterium]